MTSTAAGSHGSLTNSSASRATNDMPKYDPELDKMANPYYYDANRVLYEAHMTRLLRSQEN